MSEAHLTYLRDDVHERITVTITGPARLADLESVVERQAADGTWRYGMLYDECLGTASLSVNATRALVAVVDRMTRAHGPRGPVAIVCEVVAQFGMARMYSILGDQQGRVSNVFHDVAAAEAWLDHRRGHKGDQGSDRRKE
jgi:hypothetical protein